MPIVKPFYKLYRAFPDPDYFYLENTYAGANTLTVTKVGTPSTTDLSYSLDKSTWTNIYNGGTVSVPQGGKVYFRSTTGFNTTWQNYIKLSMSQSFVAGGKLSTLIDYTGFNGNIPNYAFTQIFNSVTNLTSIDNLDLSDIFSLGDMAFYNGFIGTSISKGIDISTISSCGNFILQNAYKNCSNLSTVYTPNIIDLKNYILTGWLSSAPNSGTIYAPTGCQLYDNSDDGIKAGWTVVDY